MIVLQLLLYCLLFTALVKIAVIGGAVNGLYFYPKEVQDRAPKELQTGNGVWRVDMMKCPYHDICTEYGCQELCRCFCDSDDISYTGLHPKLIWERSMTLGRGNDRCDFCMKIR